MTGRHVHECCKILGTLDIHSVLKGKISSQENSVFKISSRNFPGMEKCPKTVSNVMRRSSSVLWCPAGLTFSSVNIKPTLSSQSFRGQGDLLYRAVTRLETHRGKLETARRDLNGLMSSFDWFINKLTIVNDKSISLWLLLILLLCKQTGSV